MNWMWLVWGWTNSNSRVRARPSSRVKGALKPLEWAFSLSNLFIVQKNFYIRMEEKVSFLTSLSDTNSR